MNCASAYNHTAKRNLVLRTAFAKYWQSLVYLNCACSITIRYYYTRSRKSKWPELVTKYQVQWTRIMMNIRLDSSVRIKTRIRTEVTLNRICANAHNSGIMRLARNACRTDRSSTLPQLRLDYVSATPRLYLIYAFIVLLKKVDIKIPFTIRKKCAKNASVALMDIK